MNTAEQEKFPDFPVFKGLQKPLEFMGLKGRYIYWAAGAVGGGLLSFLAGYIVLAFGGTHSPYHDGGCGWNHDFIKQHKGLHTKKTPKGIFIFVHSYKYLI